MPSRSLTSEQALALLAATPRRLTAATAGLTSAHLRTAPAPGEWSAIAVLAHLRACADVWGGCIATIIAASATPTLRAINPRTWIERTDYPNLDFPRSLAAFATQRAELLAALEPLPREGWARTATVTGAGAPLRRTVLDYAGRLALHERAHIGQIERLARTPRA